MRPNYSIILPARDEELYIGNVLSTIIELTADLSCEIVVVDNGSLDNTRDIARKLGVKVLRIENTTVAAVRNFGAHHCSGKVLVFLDADVVITPLWSATLPSVLLSLNDNPMQVLGARCHAPDDGLLNRYWFNRLTEYSANYINSGNLLTSSVLFHSLKGFNESLTTAEDYDFCHRARRSGASVTELPALETLHLGYPSSIAGFVRRERWHGRQDFTNCKSLRESKVAWLATANLAVFFFSLFIIAVTLNPIWLFVYPLFIAGLSLCLTIHRFGIGKPQAFIATSAIYALYILARSLAGVDRIMNGSTEHPCSQH